MHDTDAGARRALTDSALAWLLACVLGGAWLSPGLRALVSARWPELPATPLLALLVAAAAARHWRRLADAARLRGTKARGWVALALLLFPVGGAAALLLLAPRAPAPARTAVAGGR